MMNKYEKEARVYPAIAGMIIPIILTTLSYTNRGMAKDYSLREMQILPLFR